MSKARVIYAWWVKLPLWARIPLTLVLLVALAVLAFEGVARAVKPRAPASPYRAIVESRIAQSGRSSATLNETMAKADERYAEIEKEFQDDEEEDREFEGRVRACDSIDAVDDLIAQRRGGEWGVKRDD